MTKPLHEQLREYNRWRRGDDDMPMPEPRELWLMLDAAADRLEVMSRCKVDIERAYRILQTEVAIRKAILQIDQILRDVMEYIK